MESVLISIPLTEFISELRTVIRLEVQAELSALKSKEESKRSITEVCNHYSFSDETFRKLRKELDIPYYIVSGRPRFLISEIDAVLANAGKAKGGKV